MTSIRALVALSAVVAATAGAQGIGGILPTADGAPPTRAGTRGANFLHLQVGARTNALAGAVGSSIVGSTAWFTNPAGAATIDAFSIAVGRQNLYGDLGIKQSYAAVSFPAVGGAIGFALNSLTSGDIPYTNETNPYGDPQQGQFFEWSSTAASLGYARRLTDRLDVGGSLKFISEGLPQVKTSWISGDVGTQFRTGLFGLVLGGSLLSIGTAAHADGTMIERTTNTNDVSREVTRFKLYTRPADLPTAFRFSAGDDLLGSAESLFGRGSGQHTFYAEVDVTDAVDLAAQAAVGLEYGFRNTLFLRGGRRFFSDDRAAKSADQSGFLHGKGFFGTSLGFGLRLPVNKHPFRFDYSYTAMGDLRDIQVFSLEFGGR